MAGAYTSFMVLGLLSKLSGAYNAKPRMKGVVHTSCPPLERLDVACNKIQTASASHSIG